jgi:hypothetical protein
MIYSEGSTEPVRRGSLKAGFLSPVSDSARMNRCPSVRFLQREQVLRHRYMPADKKK